MPKLSLPARRARSRSPGTRVLCAWRTAACRCLQHFCAVHGVGSAAGRARDVEGVGVRVQELVMGGLVRVRCVAVRRVRLAGDRVVGRGCRKEEWDHGAEGRRVF